MPENFAYMVVPSMRTAEMTATPMRAAISEYSIAVAPDSSFRKREKTVFMIGSNIRSSTFVAHRWNAFFIAPDRCETVNPNVSLLPPESPGVLG